jgi:two-component system response regulator (stage 0 sporulation protein A)
MDALISVLIADDNIEFAGLLREYLNNSRGITVTGTARDGVEAVNMIREQRPDVVILDLIMPNLDGIGVLERLADLRLGYTPVIIVLTAVSQDGFVQKAVQLGAEYYMVKPFEIEVLVRRIRQLYDGRNTTSADIIRNTPPALQNLSNTPDSRLESVVTELIRGVGIAPNVEGFYFLREAVVLSVENPGLLASVTRNLYPAVAARYNTTETKVSRAIRSAITASSGRCGGKEEIAAEWLQDDSREPINTRMISFLSKKAKLAMRGSGRNKTGK